MAHNDENSEPSLTHTTRTEGLKLKFDGHGAFYVYDLEHGDIMQVGLGPNFRDGHVSRQLVGELVGRNSFRMLEDSLGEWEERTVSFGTYASQFGPIQFTKSGILRGCIIPDGAVSLDHAARDFFNKGAQIEDYPEVYVNMSVNDVEFF